MPQPFVEQIRLDSFLSFPPGSEPIELKPLNVVVGPNGSGKSNLLEAFELLSAIPSAGAFQSLMELGGGAPSWLWCGGDASAIDVLINGEEERRFEYKLKWAPRPRSMLDTRPRPRADQVTDKYACILDESFVEVPSANGNPMTYFRTDGDKVVLSSRDIGPSGPEPYKTQTIDREYIGNAGSILSQRNTKGSHPDNIWLTRELRKIRSFRDWSFGRGSIPRDSQDIDNNGVHLGWYGSNFGGMLLGLSQRDAVEPINEYLREFLPRAIRLDTQVVDGEIKVSLTEKGLCGPIPATRMSDGTLRFIALLIELFDDPPPLLCIDQPELGFHPDALTQVARLLVKASEHTQIIVITHSGTLLDAFVGHEDSVLVCDYDEGTRIRPLDLEYLAELLEEHSIGELWRMGHIGGNP
ncbi:MAG: AAA family ATPase [Polyangiaceae bacterium]|nr:AAA family ATPase [Polyangiaceae bacterium]